MRHAAARAAFILLGCSVPLAGQADVGSPRGDTVSSPKTDGDGSRPSPEGSPGKAAHAQRLFREGRDALKAGNDRLACAKFRASQAVLPAPGTLINLALCAEREGALLKALDLFSRFLDQAGPEDERRTIASDHAALLEQRIPKLVLVRPSTVLETTVWLDDKPIEAFGTPLAVDPGTHRIVTRAPTHAESVTTLDVPEGAVLHYNLVLGAKLSVAPTGERPVQAGANAPTGAMESRKVGTFTYVAAGVAATGLLTGIAAGVLVLDRLGTVEAECPSKRCSQAGMNAADEARTLARVSDVGLAVGAVGSAAAALSFWSGWSEKPAGLRLHVTPQRQELVWVRSF